ncbi:MAG TPA: hypothetical protein VJH71_01190 [Candidatus Paceibacterota bacterium]
MGNPFEEAANQVLEGANPVTGEVRPEDMERLNATMPKESPVGSTDVVPGAEQIRDKRLLTMSDAEFAKWHGDVKNDFEAAMSQLNDDPTSAERIAEMEKVQALMDDFNLAEKLRQQNLFKKASS